jgi:ribosome-associated protein
VDPHLPPAEDRPSKSERKREMLARQKLGQRLIDLNPAQLERLPLSDALREAVQFAQRITSHEARRRQLQFIGRLMRESDATAIQAGFDGITGASRQAVALMHRCERLREELVADDGALARFVQDHAGVDTQWLRTKIRAVRAERAAERAPRHARELYQWLHQRLTEVAGP